MKKLGVVVCLLLLASACGDSSDSDELKALREKVSMLEEQITTTVAPATTTAGARFGFALVGLILDKLFVVIKRRLCLHGFREFRLPRHVMFLVALSNPILKSQL